MPATSAVAPAPAQRLVRIELLALDLATCGRCKGTSANLDEALRIASDRLRSQGVTAEVSKTVVTSAEQAVRLRFESSPTIRVDGHDIAFELRESDCKDCGELCGCGGGVECRVWVWRGREYEEAPVPMIVDAVLEAAAQPPSPVSPAGSFQLPENLRSFFERRARPGRGATSGCCGSTPDKPCCSPSSR